MAHKHSFEALDKSLRDIMSCCYENSKDKPFGGLTVACGGDFRQILPVIPRGNRADIVNAALNSSYLWPLFKVYELNENMCLQCNTLSPTNMINIKAFDSWMLQIGNGIAYDDVTNELLKLPAGIFPKTIGNPIESVVEMIYPSLLENCNCPSYITERAILTPKNDMVQELNTFIMDMLPGEGKIYLSSDTVCKGSVQTNEEDLLYPTEFLNGLQFNGVPNHEIQLKVGAPVMLLRNINQTEGLCNGTRLIVTLLGT
ncbi:uncharacterized protein LOC112529076 [Cynara cardunculus var. scolymus]|uniref:uncharacterized protein LOC112529076 n=1 Tax=Cynara cardunculus var. scolymus TaxID=59895 RepID=UPI000D624766|nr:uncharacterized protein LOC112529076 [Cynara cardunculus var. scolymus]